MELRPLALPPWRIDQQSNRHSGYKTADRGETTASRSKRAGAMKTVHLEADLRAAFAAKEGAENVGRQGWARRYNAPEPTSSLRIEPSTPRMDMS